MDEYHFPGFRPQSDIQGKFGDPRARVIRLKRIRKKRSADVVVRHIGATTTRKCRQTTGSILRGCPDIPGGGGTESYVQEVRYRETRETALAGKQSFLHEAICLLCRPEVLSHDSQRRRKRVETGLAHGKGAGKGVPAGAVAAQSCSSTQDNRDRRNISAERAYLPNRGQRSENWIRYGRWNTGVFQGKTVIHQGTEVYAFVEL